MKKINLPNVLFLAYPVTIMIGLAVIGFGDALSMIGMSPGLRVFIGFVWLLIPGFLVSFILLGKANRSFLIPLALALPISIALIGILGLIARTIHLNIHQLNVIWYLIIGAAVLFVLPHLRNHTWKRPDRSKDELLIPLAVMALVIILIFTVFASLTVKKANDIHLYNADVTYFASGQALDWKEIYFDSDNLISDRNAIAYWTLGQALIVYVGSVHILEALSYISGILVILMSLSILAGMRLFGFSWSLSLVGLIIHFVILGIMISDLQPGRLVLRHIIQDKELVGFVFAPVIFGLIFRITKSSRRSDIMMFGLLVIGSILTHPIMAGFIASVVGLWMLIELALKRKLYPYAHLLGLVVILFIPVLLVRQSTDLDFVTHEDVLEDNGRIWVVADTGLYIANPHAVGELSIVLLGAGLLGLTGLRKDPTAPFYIALMIVIAIGLIPFTAWIYGQLAGVYKIHRMSWIIPYGQLAVYIVMRLKAGQQSSGWRDDHIHKPASTVIILLFGMVIASYQCFALHRIDNITQNKIAQINHQLVDIGAYLESTYSDRVVVMGDTNMWVRDALAAASNVIQPVSFCDVRCMVNWTGIDPENADTQLSRNASFFSNRHDDEKRLLNLNRHHVDLMIYVKETSSQYVDSLIEKYPDSFQREYETELLSVVKYNPQTQN